MRACALTIVAILGLLLGLLVSPALAGKNANGALIVHTDDTVNYTLTGQYCGADLHVPASCETAVTRTDKDPSTPAVIWFLAAFPPTSQPAVTGISFGVDHNLPPNQGYVESWAACADQSLPGGNFPNSSPSGCIVGYFEAETSSLFAFHWFSVYGVDASSYFGTGVHPYQGNRAQFADDSIPPREDDVTKFGRVAWFSEGGYNQCPADEPEACCMADGSCELVLASECNGTPQGPGTACDPNPCAAACCISATGQCQFVNTDWCTDLGGIYQGYPTSCEEVICPQPPIGACCEFDGSCTVQTEHDCTLFGHEYHGDGTDCDPNPCLLQQGACCFPNGVCTVYAGWELCNQAGGEFQGPGTDCDPNPCDDPEGACCFDAVCGMLTAEECLTNDGDFQGPGTTCDPNPCLPTTGACCLPNGDCLILSADSCTSNGWLFQGLGVPCDPDPCTPTATSPVSWGRLKSLYR